MRRYPSRTAHTYEPSTDAMAPVRYRIQAMVDGLDAVAHAIERKWGVGRLRLLFSNDLRARFDEQKARLNAALDSEDERLVRTHADGMQRGWLALERAAIDALAQPLSPLVWECVLPSTGEVVSLVRDDTEAHHIARECRVFSLREIALLIDGLGDGVLEAKRVFPGASVIGARRKAPIDWKHGDEIPF